ncbi:unnamed protein product, partial [Prunus brigantina]
RRLGVETLEATTLWLGGKAESGSYHHHLVEYLGWTQVALQGLIYSYLPLFNFKQNPYAKLYGDHCYRNGKLGHKSNDCPNRRQVNLAEADEEDNEDHGVDEEYDGADFAYEEGDEVINIVLQRVLLAPRQEEGQRHKIFQSLCTVNNKV